MLSDRFDEVTRGEWTTIGLDVQYKLGGLDGKTLYLQCSHGKSDWIQNLKFWHRTYKDVYQNSDICFKAHAGFIELWQSIRHDIEALDFDTIVGYSQGAAIATFAHENFLHRKGYEPLTITFGSPMVLYKPSKELQSRFIGLMRFKNANDIVTLAQGLLPGYKHIGELRLLPMIWNKPKQCGLAEWLSGHSPWQYRLAIRKYQNA